MNIITICGSLKFKDEMMKISEKLALEGNCVIAPIYPTSNKERTKEQITNLKQAHFKKIELSDSIYVVNINNYIGESTTLEIEYAKKLNKKIIYHEGDKYEK